MIVVRAIRHLATWLLSIVRQALPWDDDRIGKLPDVDGSFDDAGNEGWGQWMR